MKKIILITFIFIAFQVNAQIKKVRPVAWKIPSVYTRINGLAGGFIINSFKDTEKVLVTEVNGMSIELIGLGLFMPLTPMDPIYSESKEFYKNKKNVDSLIKTYNNVKYCINGLSISAGGIGGQDIKINGVNVSGINTLTSEINGLSVCFLINYSGIVNGVSIGALKNTTLQTKGLQIGLFNKTSRLKGIQIGLWNKNEKRELPIINWNFD